MQHELINRCDVCKEHTPQTRTETEHLILGTHYRIIIRIYQCQTCRMISSVEILE